MKFFLIALNVIFASGYFWVEGPRNSNGPNAGVPQSCDSDCAIVGAVCVQNARWPHTVDEFVKLVYIHSTDLANCTVPHVLSSCAPSSSCTSIRMGGDTTNPEEDDGTDDYTNNKFADCFALPRDATCSEIRTNQRRFCPCMFRKNFH